MIGRRTNQVVEQVAHNGIRWEYHQVCSGVRLVLVKDGHKHFGLPRTSVVVGHDIPPGFWLVYVATRRPQVCIVVSDAESKHHSCVVSTAFSIFSNIFVIKISVLMDDIHITPDNNTS